MVNRSDICTLVPAAGRGSRLGGNYPKVFTPIVNDTTIWDILNSKLKQVAEQHCLVLNSKVYESYKSKLEPSLNISFQDDPIGMGDAIFQGHEHFSSCKYLIVVWGDQVHVSLNTLRKVVSEFKSSSTGQIVLPLVKQEKPYVEYVFDEGQLIKINQSREGDVTSPGGLSDMGVFGLSVSGLGDAWNEYLLSQNLGKETGEINFLPFLSFLSLKKNWEIQKIFVDDVDESRGINTPEDLAYFKTLYKRGDFS